MFGFGYRFRAAMPGAYSRFAGILPVRPPSWKQPAVFVAEHGCVEVGSLMNGFSTPVDCPCVLVFSVCEKSPVRSSSVGTRSRIGLPPLIGLVTGRYSWL